MSSLQNINFYSDFSAMDSSSDNCEGIMGPQSGQIMQIPKITSTSSLSPLQQTTPRHLPDSPASLTSSPFSMTTSPVSMTTPPMSMATPPVTVSTSPMSCSPPKASSSCAGVSSSHDIGVSLLQSPRTFIPRKLLSPVEQHSPGRSGLSSLLNPTDLEDTLSGVYVVGGAAITCNLLIWTVASFHTLMRFEIIYYIS